MTENYCTFGFLSSLYCFSIYVNYSFIFFILNQISNAIFRGNSALFSITIVMKTLNLFADWNRNKKKLEALLLFCMKSPSVWLSIWGDNNANFAATWNCIVLNGCTWWNGAIRWAANRSTWRCEKGCWVCCVVVTFRETSLNW